MRLKHFIGKGVRGYIDFNINFRESVTFLIGINGSGKTTALKLLSALLEPSYKMLCSIDFIELTLLCEVEDNMLVRILCKKDKNRMLLSYDDSNTQKQEELFEVSEMVQAYEEQRELAHEEYIKNRSEFETSKVVAHIKSLQTPLFLGINRRVIEMNIGDRIAREDSSVREVHIRRRRGMINDAVDRALFDIQNLVFDYVRHNAKRQATYADNFRKKVVHDSFKFYDSLPHSFNDDYDNQLLILEKKHENIKVAIKELALW